ncbi:MAG: GIY-YIG nuclease family protein [Gammaproteobacteria bacterium]|nr:GIY-YIG nuclease family protein [Gammaproteobacteria bacterium]
MDKYYYVYMLVSQRNGTLYLGVTANLIERVWQHKNKFVEGFTKQHGIDQLVWFEQHEEIAHAILREKQIKKWNRDWKIRLIENANPYWNDLYLNLTA